MALDPSIISGINTQFGGFDPSQAYNQANAIKQMQAQAQAQQAAMREQQKQNMLNERLSQPDALTEKGMFSPIALQDVARIDPVVAQKLYTQNAELAYKDTEQKAKQTDAYVKLTDLTLQHVDDTLEAYDRFRTEQGYTEPQAREAAQKIWNEKYDELKPFGGNPPKEFDPIKFASNPIYQKHKEERKDKDFTQNLAMTKEKREASDAKTRLALEKVNTGYAGARLNIEQRKEAREEKKAAQTSSGALNDDAVDGIADRVLAGDKTAIVGIGRGTQGAADLRKIQNAIYTKAKAKGMTPQQISQATADFAGEMAAAKSVGTMSSKIDVYANEAENASSMYLKSMEDLGNNSDLRPLTAAIQSGQSALSDPKLQKAAIAANALAMAYAKAMNPTGTPHVEDQKYARNLISTNIGKKGVKATVEQILAEIRGAKNAAKRTQGDTTGTQSSARPDPLGLLK